MTNQSNSHTFTLTTRQIVLCLTAVILIVVTVTGVLIYQGLKIGNLSTLRTAEDMGITQMTEEDFVSGTIYCRGWSKTFEMVGSNGMRVALKELETAHFQPTFRPILFEPSTKVTYVTAENTYVFEFDGEVIAYTTAYLPTRYYTCTHGNEFLIALLSLNPYGY